MKLSRRQLRRLIESAILQEELSGEEVIEKFNLWISSSMNDDSLKRVRGRLVTIIGGIKAGNYETSLSALQSLVASENLNAERKEYKKIISMLEDLAGISDTEPDTKGGKQAAKKAKKLPPDEEVRAIQDNLNDLSASLFDFTDYQGKSLTADGEWGSRTRSASSKFLKVMIEEHLANMLERGTGYLQYIDPSMESANIDTAGLNMKRKGGAGSWQKVAEQVTQGLQVQGKIGKYSRLYYLTEDFLSYISEEGITGKGKGESQQEEDPLDRPDETVLGPADEAPREGAINLAYMSADDLEDLGVWRELVNLGDEKETAMSIKDFVNSEIIVDYDVARVAGGTSSSGLKKLVIKKKGSATIDLSFRGLDSGFQFRKKMVAIGWGSKAGSPKGYGKESLMQQKGQPCPIIIQFGSTTENIIGLGSYDVKVNGKSLGDTMRIKVTGLKLSGVRDPLCVADLNESRRLGRGDLRNVIEESFSRGSLYRRRYRRY